MSKKCSLTFWFGLSVALSLLSPAAPAAPDAVPAQLSPAALEKLLDQAAKAYDSQELDLAVKLYAQAAEQNSTLAQVRMGQFSDSAQFYEEAVGWFLMAATQGDAEGQYNLGRMYETGNGIEKDEAKALYWFKRSADKKYLPAVKVVANAYRSGLMGLRVDADLAKSWDAKAARLEAIERKAADEKIAAYIAARHKLLEEEAAKKAAKNK
jgi:TPR repeat protein